VAYQPLRFDSAALCGSLTKDLVDPAKCEE